MSNQFLTDADDAEREIATIVLMRAFEKKLTWRAVENVFMAPVVDDLIVTIIASAKELTHAARWDRFEIAQGDTKLVEYYYPTQFREATMMARIAPSDIKGEIDKIFQTLKGEVVTATYGPALERLRSLSD